MSPDRGDRAVNSDEPLRIAMLAPPWRPLPPDGYGPVETVVSELTEGLVRRGHNIELFCAPGSQSTATLRTPLDGPRTSDFGWSIFEADFAARVFDAIESAHSPFDIVHDHSGFTVLAMADRIGPPVVHTMHAGPIEGHIRSFYAHHGHRAALVALSNAQLTCASGRCTRAMRQGVPPIAIDARVIPNPLDVAKWPFQTNKDDYYLLWIGRICKIKGPHDAIAAARLAGRRLILAGPVEDAAFFNSEIEPHVDGSVIEYVGEVSGQARLDLFSRAHALLMPIGFCEPFGIVMAEAMACGTPVIATAEGAAPELVQPGWNGFLANNTLEIAAAVQRIPEINPTDCRRSVSERYHVNVVVAQHEALYRAILASGTDRGQPPAR